MRMSSMAGGVRVEDCRPRSGLLSHRRRARTCFRMPVIVHSSRTAYQIGGHQPPGRSPPQARRDSGDELSFPESGSVRSRSMFFRA